MKFTFKILVDSNAIDNLNHVNNIAYLEWVQLAAQKHWSKLAKNIERTNLAWVVLRHEIDYIAPAFINDKLTIETWVGESIGVSSVRHVQILKNSKVIVKAKTKWCLVDAIKKKPLRIDSELLKLLNSAKSEE